MEHVTGDSKMALHCGHKPVPLIRFIGLVTDNIQMSK